MRKMKVKGELNDEQFILSMKQSEEASRDLDSLSPDEIDKLVLQIHHYADAAEHLEVASEYEDETHDILENTLKDYSIKKVKLEIKRECEDICPDCSSRGEYITTLKIKKDKEQFVGLDIVKLMTEDPDLYKVLVEKFPLEGSEYTFDLE